MRKKPAVSIEQYGVGASTTDLGRSQTGSITPQTSLSAAKGDWLSLSRTFKQANCCRHIGLHDWQLVLNLIWTVDQMSPGARAITGVRRPGAG